MAKLVKNSNKPILVSKDTAEQYVKEYNFISAQIKKLDERKKYLADIIKNYAKTYGTKDDKGSYYCENDSFVYGLVQKIQTVPRDNIFDSLRQMKLDDCIEYVEKVNMDKLNKYHDEGIITDEEITKLFTIKELTPSISVKEKKEMPTIEQTKATKK